MGSFVFFVFTFLLCAFAGWLWEVLFNLVVHKRWRLHGYLTMPLLPIYGFSAVGIMLLAGPYRDNPLFVAIVAMSVVTVVEYITSLVLERVFRIHLWDYSDWPFNIAGRVSLVSSLGFGCMGLLVVYGVEPFVASLAVAAPSWVVVIAYIVLGLVIVDFLNATSSLLRLRISMRRVLASLDDAQSRLELRMSALREKRRRFRVALDVWYRYNLRHLRRAFPRAEITSRLSKKKHP